MFGLLYQESLQTGPRVFIWIFHFILPRVIRLFRVYCEWWIISFSPRLHSLQSHWTARAAPYRWRQRVRDRCLVSSLNRRSACLRPAGREALHQFFTRVLREVETITHTDESRSSNSTSMTENLPPLRPWRFPQAQFLMLEPQNKTFPVY